MTPPYPLLRWRQVVGAGAIEVLGVRDVDSKFPVPPLADDTRTIPSLEP